jgi:hypothetical protein
LKKKRKNPIKNKEMKKPRLHLKRWGAGFIFVTCAFLSNNLDPSCEALKKIGGNAKSVYMGHTGDLATCTFATEGDIATMTLDASTYLYKYTSKAEKISITYNVTPGANVNTFLHEIKIPLYHASQAERKMIQDLCLAEDLFIIVQELSGVLTVLGINNTTTGEFDEFGLKTTAGEGGSGTTIQDDTAYTVTLTRDLPNMPMQYKPGTALATNITALDALVYVAP